MQRGGPSGRGRDARRNAAVAGGEESETVGEWEKCETGRGAMGEGRLASGFCPLVPWSISPLALRSAPHYPLVATARRIHHGDTEVRRREDLGDVEEWETCETGRGAMGDRKRDMTHDRFTLVATHYPLVATARRIHHGDTEARRREDLGDVEEWETNETAVAGGDRVEAEDESGRYGVTSLNLNFGPQLRRDRAAGSVKSA